MEILYRITHYPTQMVGHACVWGHRETRGKNVGSIGRITYGRH